MTRWIFDRLGDNDKPPALTVPDDAPYGDGLDLLLEHARRHIQSSGDWRVDPMIRERRIGGYEIRSRSTGYLYGVARRSPIFIEDTFAAAAEASLGAAS